MDIHWTHIKGFPQHWMARVSLHNILQYSSLKMAWALDWSGFYTKGRPLVKSNLFCPSDKLSWQPGCPVFKYQYTRKFLYQPRKSPFRQPARKLFRPLLIANYITTEPLTFFNKSSPGGPFHKRYLSHQSLKFSLKIPSTSPSGQWVNGDKLDNKEDIAN